ncbi:MAG: OmpA family protein [Deltaproteobacteria bacterium]|nr:OmpA family protein [Deltaproteobacteria bacterium]
MRSRLAAAACLGLLAACGNPPAAVFVRYDTGVDEPKGPDEYMNVGIALTRLRDDTALHVLVVGYADARGDNQSNRELSFRRARRVRELLLSHGVEPGRIRVAARGEDRPVASNLTVEGQSLNRRSELFFYEPGGGDVRVQYGAELHFDAN